MLKNHVVPVQIVCANANGGADVRFGSLVELDDIPKATVWAAGIKV
jgi:hypothetical protein